MARVPGQDITITVTNAAPSGDPAEFFGDLAADAWEIDYFANAALLVLTGPAELWGFMTEGSTWVQLEDAFRTTTRTVQAGEAISDLVQRAKPGISALHVTYTTIVGVGSPTFVARTIRIETP